MSKSVLLGSGNRGIWGARWAVRQCPWRPRVHLLRSATNENSMERKGRRKKIRQKNVKQRYL